MLYRFISADFVPCWYELSWQEKETAILLKVHEDFVKLIPAMPKDSPIVQGYMNDFGFSDFSGDLKGDFGFSGGKFKHLGIRDNFHEFLIPLPKIKVKTKKPCCNCKGKKTDQYDGQECKYCDGTGVEHEMVWDAPRAICAGLRVFFLLATWPKEETSSKLPQLITLDTYVSKDIFNGASFGGAFGTPFVRWLCGLLKCKTVSFPEAERAMFKANERMFGKTHAAPYDFKAYFSGMLIIRCPGNACGISSSSYSEGDKGYKFGSDNVDSVSQQLILISGLASVHDAAREGMKPE
jgi:hypothetical protein